MLQSATRTAASLSGSEFVALGHRIDELVDGVGGDLPLSWTFRKACLEYGLDAEAIADALGCECPYALLGYVEAERLDALSAAENDD